MQVTDENNLSWKQLHFTRKFDIYVDLSSLGVPLAADIIDLPAQTKDVEVVIKWNEPQNNGALITQYTVYQRTVSDDGIPSSWQKLKVITDVSVRHFAVQLEKGKEYEFVVTASNKFGESFKAEEIVKRINILSGKS